MVAHALQRVLRKPTYLSIALCAATAMYLFAVWFPNMSLIVRVMEHPNASLSQKAGVLVGLSGSITSNFTLLSASYTIAIAGLFGIDLAFIVYFLRRRVDTVKQSGTATGFLGIASGIVGIGCAACGSLLLTSFFSLVGASAVLALLPLKGGEFGILGVVLLGVSIYMTAKKIQNPAVCKINP